MAIFGLRNSAASARSAIESATTNLEQTGFGDQLLVAHLRALVHRRKMRRIHVPAPLLLLAAALPEPRPQVVVSQRASVAHS